MSKKCWKARVKNRVDEWLFNLLILINVGCWKWNLGCLTIRSDQHGGGSRWGWELDVELTKLKRGSYQ